MILFLVGAILLNLTQADNSVLSLLYKFQDGKIIQNTPTTLTGTYFNEDWLIDDFNYATKTRRYPLPETRIDYYSSIRRKDPSLAPSADIIDEVDQSLSYFNDEIQQKLLNALAHYERGWKEALQKQSEVHEAIDRKYKGSGGTNTTAPLMQSFYEKWVSTDEISVERPLIMFHQRKSGGSSIRITMHFASIMLGIPAYISCYTQPCDAYHIEYEQPYAVYAGHYPWGIQNRLSRFQKSMRSSHFSCITNYRHPMDRIDSCLYFRFPEILSGRCLNDLTFGEFKSLLFMMDDYGNSCLNEPFRMLSGESNEILIDHMMDEKVEQLLLDENDREDEEHAMSDFAKRLSETTNLQMRELKRLRSRRGLQGMFKQKDHEAVTPLNGRKLKDTDNSTSQHHHSGFFTGQPQSLHDHVIEIFEQTLVHAKKCLPLVLEIPETYEWIAAKYPSLGAFGGFSSDIQVMAGGDHKKCTRLEGDKLALVRHEAALEILLYNAVYNRTREEVLTFHHDREKYIDANDQLHNKAKDVKKQRKDVDKDDDSEKCYECYEAVQIEKRVPIASQLPDMLHENGASRVAYVQTGGFKASLARWLLEQATGFISNSYAYKPFTQRLFSHDIRCTTTDADKANNGIPQGGALFINVEPGIFRYFDRKFQSKESQVPPSAMSRKQSVIGPDPANNISFYAIPALSPPWNGKEACPNVQGDRFEKALLLAKDPFVFLWQVLWNKKAIEMQQTIPALHARGRYIQDWFTESGDLVKPEIYREQFVEVQHYLNDLLTVTWIAPNATVKARLSHKELTKLYHVRHFVTHFRLSTDASEPTKGWREWIQSSLYSYYFSLFFDRNSFVQLFDQNYVRLTQNFAEYVNMPYFADVKAGRKGYNLLPMPPWEIVGLNATSPSMFGLTPPKPLDLMNGMSVRENVPIFPPSHFLAFSTEALMESLHTLKLSTLKIGEEKVNEKKVEHAWKVLHRITDFLGLPRKYLDICRLRCASELLLFPEKFKMEDEIQQVRVFYESNPGKLEFTKRMIYYLLGELGIDSKIFRFMFDL